MTIRANPITITISTSCLYPPKFASLSNRWPAIILTVIRTDKVTGRISELRNSTKTKKKARPKGTPLGTMHENHPSLSLVNIQNWLPPHNVTAIKTVNDQLLEGGVIKGISPLKLKDTNLKNSREI